MVLAIPQTIATLKHALLRDLGDEVELIFRFGSQTTGNTHSYSDLDISFIPVHESTWYNITVLINDTLVDLFPLHWSQLERMANFDDVRGTLLLHNEIVYARADDAVARFRGLGAQLCALQQPEARPAMLRKAQTLFQSTGYSFYLLHQHATQGHLVACFQQAQQILKTVLHCLVVCNQTSVDTRKLAQVLALPKLPIGFAALVEVLTQANTPDDLLTAAEALLNATRDLLLAEQRQVQVRPTTFAEVLDSGYPELKGDLQHVLLACERRDMFLLHDKLMSLYHELLVHVTQAITGIAFSDFNSLADYEQDLGALGFPALWPYVVAQDYAGLHTQTQAFDRRLQAFLTEHGVALNAFASLADLQQELGMAAMSLPQAP